MTHVHAFDETYGTCACGDWVDHFNCACGSKTTPAFRGDDKCMGCGAPFEDRDVPRVRLEGNTGNDDRG